MSRAARSPASSPLASVSCDLREGGRWTPAQSAKNDALYVLASSALFVAERLPTRALHVLGRGLGALAWALVPSARSLAVANVARALPEVAPAERGRFVRRVYARLGSLLGDAVAMLDPSRPIEPLPFLPGSRECLEEAISHGRGVLLASAHLGPWERVAATLATAGFPLTVIAREPYDPRLRRVYERLRDARGVRTVYRGRGRVRGHGGDGGADGALHDSGTAMELFRVLRTGGVLAIAMDLASRVPSVDAPFLGSPAPTAVGPARLAVRTGAAVVVATAAPHGAGGDLAVSCVRVPSSGSELDVTEGINRELSARIRALPDAWPWMHRRWPA